VHVISARFKQRKVKLLKGKGDERLEERLKKLRVLLDWGGLGHFAFVRF